MCDPSNEGFTLSCRDKYRSPLQFALSFALPLKHGIKIPECGDQQHTARNQHNQHRTQHRIGILFGHRVNSTTIWQDPRCVY